MKKWAKRLAVGVLGCVVVLVVVGFVFERRWRWHASRRFPPPGRMVDAEGAATHLHCMGTGSPTVLLESGLDPAGSQAWVLVQPEIAAFTRVCAYDRAGLMWSEARHEPRDARVMARELRAILAEASEHPPYVLVGHSMGGLLVRVFASSADENTVVGFVLVDASHPEQHQRAPSAVGDAPPGWLIDTLASLGVLRLLDAAVPPAFPSETAQCIAAYAPQSVSAMLAERRVFEETLAQAKSTGPFGRRPLVVLTSGIQARERKVWLELQRELVGLSRNSDHRILDRAGHYLQVDDPQAVVAAVRDVVTAAREGTVLRR